MEKRFEQRFEQIDKRFDQIMSFLWMLVAIFVGIITATIGFAIWDRRTMIRPFEIKVKLLEETDRKVIDALRDLAKEDKKLADILRSLGLL
ncbi:MAG: hypothetical protein ABIL04_02260 [candidate division WOR-3 bacterium]